MSVYSGSLIGGNREAEPADMGNRPRIKCAVCREWCGDKITPATPRERATMPRHDICTRCEADIIEKRQA